MKKIVFFVFFAGFATSAHGQQFLWSTVRDLGAGRYVPLENVTTEVLEFHDQFSWYFDYTGFSRERFMAEFWAEFLPEEDEELYDGYGNDLDLVVFAFRVNLGRGRGSAVMVMTLSQDNANAIIFSNSSGRGARLAAGTRRNQFESWFRTLLN